MGIYQIQGLKSLATVVRPPGGDARGISQDCSLIVHRWLPLTARMRWCLILERRLPAFAVALQHYCWRLDRDHFDARLCGPYGHRHDNAID
jgi:hypothetical protein